MVSDRQFLTEKATINVASECVFVAKGWPATILIIISISSYSTLNTFVHPTFFTGSTKLEVNPTLIVGFALGAAKYFNKKVEDIFFRTDADIPEF